MNILMISTDRKVFDPESGVHERMKEYGELVDSLHIVVFSSRKHDEVPNGKFQISNNTWAYPTNSLNRWMYVFDAIRIGKKVLGAWGLEFNNFGDEVLVTAQDPFAAGLVGYWLSRRFSARLQLQVHTDFLSPYFKRDSLLNKLRVRMARFLLPKADCVRVVSERIKDSLNSKFKIRNSKISVLPIYTNTVNATSAGTKNANTEYEKTILIVSRLEPEKNVGLGIKAFSRIAERFPDVGLLIAGDGSRRAALEKTVQEKGIEDRVKFLGWRDDTAFLYQQADVYLHTANFEGYGRTLVEAALNDCAIVTTDVGIVGYRLKDGQSALVCPPQNPECLAEKLTQLLNDGSKADSLSAAAKKSAQKPLFANRDEYLQAMKKSWYQC